MIDGTGLPNQSRYHRSVKPGHLSMDPGINCNEIMTVRCREERSSANKVEEVSASHSSAHSATTTNCSNEANYVNIKNRCCLCSSNTPSKETQLYSSVNTICNTCRSSDKRVTARPSETYHFTPIEENAKEEVIYIIKGEIREKVITGAHESQTPSSRLQLPSRRGGKVIKATDLLTSSSSLSSSSLLRENQPSVKQLLDKTCNSTLIKNRSHSKINKIENSCRIEHEDDDILPTEYILDRNYGKTPSVLKGQVDSEKDITRPEFEEKNIPIQNHSLSEGHRGSVKQHYPLKDCQTHKAFVLSENTKEGEKNKSDIEKDSKHKIAPELNFYHHEKTENNIYHGIIGQDKLDLPQTSSKPKLRGTTAVLYPPHPEDSGDCVEIVDIDNENIITQISEPTDLVSHVKQGAEYRFSKHFLDEQEPNDRYEGMMGEDKRHKSVSNHLGHTGKMNNSGEKRDGTLGTSNSSINRRASLAKIYTRNRTSVSASNLSSVSSSSNKIYSLNKNKSNPSKSGLDSDGTSLGSGGDSDSSEEIHYGPGFVNKLKSRYLSVALRSSGPGRPSLRRTASLEDFLDKDKDDNQIEIRRTTVNNIRNTRENKNRKASPASSTQRHGIDAQSSNTTSGAYQSNRSRGRPTAKEKFSSNMKNKSGRYEAVKRCQSVEVLSINEQVHKEGQKGKPMYASNSAKRVEVTKIEPDEDDEEPPPLPPKSELHKPPNVYTPKSSKSPIQTVLKSPTMANDVSVVDKNGDVLDGENISNSPNSDVPTSTVLASMRRPFQKRRSSGLLFGVEERELPAPDTVRETRKIFESRSSSTLGKKLLGPNGQTLTKSRSTSSLYSTKELPSSNSNNSRYNKSNPPRNLLDTNTGNQGMPKSKLGPSFSSHLALRAGVSVERSNSNSKSPVRRVTSSPNRNVANSNLAKKQAQKQNSQSPTRRTSNTSSSYKPSLQRNAPKVTNKPTLPSKPAHLSSSISSSGLKSSKSSSPSNVVSSVKSSINNGNGFKQNNSIKNFQASITKETHSEPSNTMSPLEQNINSNETSATILANKNIKLVPVRPLKSEARIVQNNGGPDWKAKPSSPPLSAEDIEEGVKLISIDSIRNIRQGGNSFSFNFHSENGINTNIKSYLPNINKKPILLPTEDDEPQYHKCNPIETEEKSDFSNNISSNVPISNTNSVAPSYCYGYSPSSSVPKQVGVIKPMTRQDLIMNDGSNGEEPTTSPRTSPISDLKPMYGENRPQANMNSTDVLNKMNINMSQVAAIRAAASKPAAGITDNEYPAKYKKEETASEESTAARTNYFSKLSTSDKNNLESSKHKQEVITANKEPSVHSSINREQEEQTMTNHVLMSTSINSSNRTSSSIAKHGVYKSDSSPNNSCNIMSSNKNCIANNKNNVPSVIKEQQQRDLSNNNETFNDLIVSATPAKVVSMKKGDSLSSSSASNSSSSDEENAADRNGSYDFVLEEENRKNGIISTNIMDFPAKKYESSKTKAEVSKELKQNDSNKNTPNNSTKAGNLGPNGEATYRENWKARSKAEQQKPENTMVFNFVNSKRDVTHIENDGLDLSKRSINSKKKTQIQLSKVR